MKPYTSLPSTADRRLTTEEFAAAISLQPQSIRKRLSQTGSFYSVKPYRLPNRRLLWPADVVEQLLMGAEQ